MPPTERQRRLDLQKEVDEIKAEVITTWHRIRRISDEIVTLQDKEVERQSRDTIDRYRDEMPSETKFSLHPTGIRLLLKNTSPSAFLVVVIVLGIVAIAWLFRHP